MNHKDEIIMEPIYGSEEQIKKGFCEESWFLISAITDEPTKLFYFNPSIDPLEYNNFKEFVESNMDSFSCPGDSSKPNSIIKDNYASVSSYSGELEEDFDEDSRKTFQVAVGKGAIMEFHKGGFNKEKLSELITTIEKDLANLESEGACEAKESADYHADPYRYYGVSRNDF